MAIMHFPHPKVKNLRRIHRIVVRPEFQGLGIGIKFMNVVGDYYRKQGFRFSIVTSLIGLIKGLSTKHDWVLKRHGRNQPNINGSGSADRITATFELR